MGISTVAVYSDADAEAKHVKEANEAVHIGASPASESYLNIEKIIAAAKQTGADAIHPGYGFLSENHVFAQAVIDAGIIWIGPPPAAIEAMGDKRRAKLILKDVPLVPGYNGDDQSDEAFIRAANEIAFPIMVKAAAGGGGKGMRAVYSAADLPDALESARREASQAFGDSTLILERLIQNPRHIEIQIFGDTHGNVVSLGERECSIQRRHQKLIEEAPSPIIDQDLRVHMSEVAINIGKQLNYVNAGTVEFLVDADKNFYFMEMNTRLQVEHRVTEDAAQIGDMVEIQLHVANGKPLETRLWLPRFDLSAEKNEDREIFPSHGIEVRIYAEDPINQFLPTSGEITQLDSWLGTTHPYITIDTGFESFDAVTTFYDSLIAKISVSSYAQSPAERRADAIQTLDSALSRMRILGVKTNIDFLRRVINHPEFIAGNFDTGFIDRHSELLVDPAPPPIVLIAAALAKSGDLAGHWRNNPYCPVRQTFQFDEQKVEIFLTKDVRNSQAYRVIIGGVWGDTLNDTSNEVGFDVIVWERDDYDDEITLSVNGHRQCVTVAEGDDDVWWAHGANDGTFKLVWVSPLPSGDVLAQAGVVGSLRAPMPGTIIAVHAENGQQVDKGDILLVIEAMKMEHRIKAPHAGIVAALRYGVGQYVQEGVPLLELQSLEEIDPL
jgi:3-methylcrotonyl-CoA carboxylase alpha subunit